MTTTSPTKERVTTIGEGGRRFWLYPASFKGLWLKRRQWLAAFLIVLFFVLPWIKIDGHQAVLLNIVDRKFAFFGIVFWPQDFYIFWFFVVGGIVCIFLITALWGRLWCGWACPQTVFLEHVFRRIEKWIEGDAMKRRRLDRGPWTWEKLRKKTLKLSLFMIISIHFANTVLCYFAGSDHVMHMTFTAPGDNWSWFTFMAFLSFLFFADFAWFREQFCIIACPYGRFQSALLDEHSLIVGYDYGRGEPREHLRKGVESKAGDCIDCNRCVAVCPTGIDIRMGLQMECVNCTACMDACDEVMEKVGRDVGLIRYTSISELEGKSQRSIRLRTVAYSILAVFLLAAGSYALLNKREYSIQILRAAGSGFSRVQSDHVINHFQVKISNRTSKAITIEPCLPPGFELTTALRTWNIPAQSTQNQSIFVSRHLDKFSPDGKERLVVSFRREDKTIFQDEITLIGPAHED